MLRIKNGGNSKKIKNRIKVTNVNEKHIPIE